MSPDNGNPFIHYLLAKKSLDDRSLSGEVWRELVHQLPTVTAQKPLKILEVGAGIGTMFQRILERGLLTYAEYTLVDSDPALVAYGLERIPGLARENGYETVAHGQKVLLNKPGFEITASFQATEALAFVREMQGSHPYDLVIAHAFLDLLDLNEAIPALFSALKPGGLFYFTINFDGLTALEPCLDRQFDDLIQSLYHQTMDERTTNGHPSGDSRTGRHLFSLLKIYGGQILASGASDWVVFSGPQGYPYDEAFFLRFIIETIEKALCGHPQLDPARFAAWIQEHLSQIERGELVYIAHQIDFLGTKPC